MSRVVGSHGRSWFTSIRCFHVVYKVVLPIMLSSAVYESSSCSSLLKTLDIVILAIHDMISHYDINLHFPGECRYEVSFYV